MSTAGTGRAPGVRSHSGSEAAGSAERAVEALVFHLYKAFTAMRMYDTDHPALHSSLKQLLQSFDEFLADHGELKIQLTDSEMRYGDIPVYHEEKRRGGLIFMLFNDGIREIRFEPGLTGDEIFEFLKALRTNSRVPQEERDIVSLFWSRGFSHIHYLAVEEIPDEEIESVDRTIAELESRWTHRDLAGETESDTPFAFGDIESDGVSDRETIRSNPLVLSQLKEVDQRAVEMLLRSIDGDRHFDPNMELIRLLFDVLHLEEEENRFLLSLKLLEDYSDELLVKGRFSRLNHIMTSLKTFIDGHRTRLSLLSQHTEVVLSRFSGSEKMALLMKGLKECPTHQQDELRLFITHLNPESIGRICTLLEDVEDPATRRSICKGLAVLAAGQTSRLAGSLEHGSVKVGKDIVSILQQMADADAVALLKTCVRHQQAVIREEAVRALRALDHPLAGESLIPFLSDEDPTIRILSAEGLESCVEIPDIDPLLTIVRQKHFRKRSQREKKALLSVLGTVACRESIDTLEAILARRSLFGRKRNTETRVCAAMALSKVDSDRARHLLKRYSRDSSAQLRHICKQALSSREARR